ncbi:hypothetical protein ADM96_39225 [Burkholderia sp. ST111]|nr:hypothetical protein ADM96_39225 [Burkholderia sp. ST111]
MHNEIASWRYQAVLAREVVPRKSEKYAENRTKTAGKVIHHLCDEKSPWDVFLQTSKEFMGADAAAFIMFDGEQNLDEPKHSYYDSAPVHEYLDHFYKYDAIAQASSKSPAGKRWDSPGRAKAALLRRLYAQTPTWPGDGDSGANIGWGRDGLYK